jgi:hypothetical protein
MEYIYFLRIKTDKQAKLSQEIIKVEKYINEYKCKVYKYERYYWYVDVI